MKARFQFLTAGISLLAIPLAFAGSPDKKLAKMDTDGDGVISRAEHTAGAQRMFAEMDANGDGVATAAEIDAKHQAKHGDKNVDKSRKLASDDMLATCDKNGDRQLTVAEHTAGVDTMFDQMDTNKDSSLSKEEIEAGHHMKAKGHDR